MESLFKEVPSVYEENYQDEYKTYILDFSVYKKRTKVVVKDHERKDFIAFVHFSKGFMNGYCLNDMFDFVCYAIDHEITLGHQCKIQIER